MGWGVRGRDGGPFSIRGEISPSTPLSTHHFPPAKESERPTREHTTWGWETESNENLQPAARNWFGGLNTRGTCLTFDTWGSRGNQ